MTTSSKKARSVLSLMGKETPLPEVFDGVLQKPPREVSDTIYVPAPLSWSEQSRQKRIHFLRSLTSAGLEHLIGEKKLEDVEVLRGNIENYVGMSQIPTGVIGPLMVNGTQAKGYFYVPMATSEGALIASYNRGAKVCLLSGGVSVGCLTEGVQRSPLFRFHNLSEVGNFIQWTLEHFGEYQAIVSQHSRFARLEEIKFNMEGNQVLLVFEYLTGDASGQNMVTICTDAVCRYIVDSCPIKPTDWFIESNYSGDKKATTVSFNSVRGKKVTAEICVPRKVVEEVLRTTPEQIALYWHSSSTATSLSGAIGIQGHYANGLAALFIACGQDVACVSEASVGITRMEVTRKGDFYAAVTLPNLIVGTVGGGTSLPTQRNCLELLDCYGAGKARKFAEICAATVLAGELSITASIAGGQFAKAHKLFGRGKKKRG